MRKEVVILLVIVAVVVGAAVLGAGYYQSSVQPDRKTANSNSGASARIDPATLIKPDSPTRGPANAPVTIVEFYDPECESCKAMYPIIKEALSRYEGKVRLVMRYMPLHGNSVLAAQVTEAAGEQGKYWQMQDLLFQRQQEWGEKREPQTALFEKYAGEIGVNVDQMRAAIADNRAMAKIDRDRREGQSIGVNRTPTIFINGRQLARLGQPELYALIEDELKSKTK